MLSSSSAVNAKAFPDGTTDYVPLRSNKRMDANKVHISDMPMTWSNWHEHVNWLNTTLIIFVPLVGFISAYWVPLRLHTATFAVIYYFNTALGITAGKCMLVPRVDISLVAVFEYD